MELQRRFWQTTRLIVPGYWVTRLLVSLVVAAVASTAAAVLASGFTSWWFREPAIPQNAFLTSDELPQWKSRSKSYLFGRDSLHVEDSSVLSTLLMRLDSTQPVDPNVRVISDPTPAALRQKYDLWRARTNERYGPFMAYVTVKEAGFPFRAVEGASVWGAPPELMSFFATDLPGLQSLTGDRVSYVVCGPLWFGIAGNTLCWGLLLFVVLSLLQRQRLRFYAKTGLHEKCKDESGTLAKGPESGMPRA